jgi:hypothetical protein
MLIEEVGGLFAIMVAKGIAPNGQATSRRRRENELIFPGNRGGERLAASNLK